MDDFFSEMSTDEKRTALRAAQKAYIDLSTGGSIASAEYAQANGSRKVTYRNTDLTQLTALIEALRLSLGMSCRRRALGIV